MFSFFARVGRTGTLDLRASLDGEELAGLAPAVAEARKDLQRLAIHDVDSLVLAVGQIHVLLLRVFRERDVPHRAIP